MSVTSLNTTVVLNQLDAAAGRAIADLDPSVRLMTDAESTPWHAVWRR